MKLTMLLLAGVLLSVPVITNAQELSEMSELKEGWNVIPTSEVCSSGTPYQFFVKPGNDDLTVFFNPGGACWGGQQCDLKAEPVTHLPFAQMDGNNPANFDGIFAIDNPNNPIAASTMVVLPYCTGDVFVGSGKVDYTYKNADGDDVNVEVFHEGESNSKTVLDWVYKNVPEPEKVLVAGSSAGALGSSFYAGLIAQNYSDKPVVLIADSAGGYDTPNISKAFKSWNTASILPNWEEYAGKTNENLTFQDFYIASANRNPNLTIAQINSADDKTQEQFTYMFGDAPGSFSITDRVFGNYDTIENAAGELVTYTTNGQQHVILMAPEFYEYSIEGKSMRDWFAALVNGDEVSDVSCVDDAAGCK